jgi:NAD(P)-dependent dehydrogenase (short-subunit alcohol dehydrogenase family)
MSSHETESAAPDDLMHRLVAVLESLAGDRSRLAALPEPVRLRLLIAAGQLSRPQRAAMTAAAKRRRRANRSALKQADAELRAATELRASQRASTFLLPGPTAEAAPPPSAGTLAEEVACYVCKRPYRTLHFFYHAMCPTCADFNYAKRSQTAALPGQVALVTGARVKIGFHIALKLLRAGAEVVATTRFPHDAADRYAREVDYDDWKHRLRIYGLDLRHVPSVEVLAEHLAHTTHRLDILINNAAQTVRRPPGFYARMIAREDAAVESLSEAARPLLQAHHALRRELAGLAQGTAAAGPLSLSAERAAGAAIGLLAPARLSQVPCLAEDFDAASFREGELDVDEQQVDRRTMNSWRMRLDQVSTQELVEVHLVNAISPFVLNRRLKPLLLRQREGAKHIVNVSAMEGQFARHKKTDKHPHTNMAKASLNMMTRTSAVDYVRDNIYMNSVDTGWITDEDPLVHVARKQRVHDFHPPLDAIDGAARVLDPVFVGASTGKHMWGLFLKDYQSAPW